MTEDERYTETLRKKYTQAELTKDDSLILEMLQRGDWFALFGMGTMRVTMAMLRLHCHGMIRMADRAKLPFDERQRVQALLDSQLYRGYVSTMSRVVDGSDKRFFEAADNIMGIDHGDILPYTVSITEDGQRRVGMEIISDADYEEASRKYRSCTFALYGGIDSGVPDYPSMGAGMIAGGLLGGAAHGALDA